MKTYQLKCPNCPRIRDYKSNSAYNLAKNTNSSCRNCSTQKCAIRNGDCSILLNNSNESYYWIGFILADGHIENSNRLQVTLAIKDIDHLEKLALYLGTSIKYNKFKCWLAIMDTVNNNKLCNLFDINSNKTECPPNLSVFNIDYDKLLSLFCGFIDGDGSIRNLHKRLDFNLHIKCHSSWKNILNLFSNKFLDNCTVKLNKQGYSFMSCGNTKLLKNFKNKCLNLNLPLMSRKWDIIDLNYKGKYEISRERILEVKKYLLLGYNQTKIRKILNLSKGGISLLIKRNKL